MNISYMILRVFFCTRRVQKNTLASSCVVCVSATGFFVTNTELPSEKVVVSYEKCGNSENYIKEAKYDMAVGHLGIQ